jgi:hypothetical protein
MPSLWYALFSPDFRHQLTSLQHVEMNSNTKMAAFHKFRGNTSIMMKQQPTSRVLVVFDVQIKSSDVFQVPLVINYGMFDSASPP